MEKVGSKSINLIFEGEGEVRMGEYCDECGIEIPDNMNECQCCPCYEIEHDRELTEITGMETEENNE